MKRPSFFASAVFTRTRCLLASCRATLLPLLLLACMPLSGDAHESGQAHIHFQKPNLTGQSTNEGLQFRSSSEAARTQQAAQRPAAPVRQAAAPAPRAAAQPAPQPVAAAKPRVASKPAYVAAAERQQQAVPVRRASTTAASYRDDSVEEAGFFLPEAYTRRTRHLAQAQSCDICVGECQCEPGCGIGEPGCGMIDPGCGIAEPGCGILEPTCGCQEPGCGICDYEPGCGLAEPDCGCDVGCGSCIGEPDDYACIPICIPRFRELTIWAGTHGFKGPRDSFSNGPGDGNFGFQEGIGIGGRAPIIGLMFPEIGYQVGYQAVQSRHSGTSDGDSSTRSQNFMTAGLFRRVNVGLQYGVVFDLMHDDLISENDFHQTRYEISLKSPRGHEFGFWGASGTNTVIVDDITYEAVNQYAGFYRWHFKNGAVGRIWGGGTDDEEGLLGADFESPLNDRWSMQAGFNYLISDADAGIIGAREESWNVGMNLIWHFGKRARAGSKRPFQPLFRVADNGWMFIDETLQ